MNYYCIIIFINILLDNERLCCNEYIQIKLNLNTISKYKI